MAFDDVCYIIQAAIAYFNKISIENFARSTYMEKIQFDYSLKDIPIPSRNAYKSRLLNTTESFIKRMRWKAYFFLNPSTERNGNPYNLKSRKYPPTIPQLEQFENDMFSMINNTKFRSVNTLFQSKLKNDITNVNNSDKVYVFADKSRNIYKMEKESYKKLLKENITSSYKIADKKATTNINRHLKQITTKLNIASQVETMTTTDAFISLKDHKENFQNKPKCRLINPAKNNFGVISKSIVENINKTVRASTKLNQ